MLFRSNATLTSATGNISFNGAVDGGYGLTTSTPGTTSFNGKVGNSTKLSSVNVLAAGLVGNYYSNSSFSGTPIVALAPSINYPNLRTNGLPPGIPSSNPVTDLFSIVWTGFIVPSTTEAYTFSSYNDDGFKLFLNGQQIINNNYAPFSGSPAVSQSVNLTEIGRAHV